MREFPKGGIIGKAVHLIRAVSELKIPLHAANAGFFIILSLFSLQTERMHYLLNGFMVK